MLWNMSKSFPEDAIRIICTSRMHFNEISDVEIDRNVILDNMTRVNCSWCEKICPTGAANTIKPFKGEVILQKKNEEEEKNCTGEACHACQDVCPCNAIILDDKITINQEVCVLSGTCEKACLQKILSVNRTSTKLSNIKSNSWQNIIGSLLNQ